MKTRVLTTIYWMKGFLAEGTVLLVATLGLRAAVTMVALGAALVAGPVAAQVQPFPAGFHTREVATNGATIHVRVGGAGPAVVLLHGYGETGDMWAPLAAELASDHTVIVPDLRGLGLSSHPPGGYDKKTQAGDVAGVLDALHVDRVDLVGDRKDKRARSARPTSELVRLGVRIRSATRPNTVGLRGRSRRARSRVATIVVVRNALNSGPDLGFVTVLAVAIAAFAFALACLHLLRLAPARRLASSAVAA